MIFFLWMKISLGCLTALLLSGCCHNSLRGMHADLAEMSLQPNTAKAAMDSSGVTTIAPDDTFRLEADGPKRDQPELLKDSNVGPATWFLYSEDKKRRIKSVVTAEAGGHLCMRGINFHLKPSQPLEPGRYALFLLVDDVRWPLNEKNKREVFEGKNVLVRRFRVAGAAISVPAGGR